MGVVDRTPEFRSLIMTLSKGQGIAQPFGQQPQVKSEVNIEAGIIGSEIEKVTLRVQELRKMAKKKGIFNDQSAQIEQLSAGAQKDIQRLNSKIEELAMRAKGKGPNTSATAHSNNMVQTLKTRLLAVTKDFKDALEDRTKTLEVQDKRRSMYTAGGDAVVNPFSQHRAAHVPSADANDPEGGGMAAAQMYHSSRSQAVQNVQQRIGELGQMFQKMAVMVTAQEEMIQRIDHDVDDTAQNMENAQNQLLHYFNHISSNRALILKVFAILIFFVVFFIVFLA
jgi:syntaxin 5